MSGQTDPPRVPRIAAGSPFTADNRRTAELVVEVAKDELPRVRTAALAWRNGLGALLVGVVGFGLIKGRSDIGQLAPPFAVIVGVLLMLALASGVVAALLLLRAAHGRAGPVKLGRLLKRKPGARNAPGSPDHRETLTSARALHGGVIVAIVCLVFLCGAVGTTWYGPSADQPRLRANTAGDETCGEVVRAADSILSLKRGDGVLVDIPMKDLIALQAVESCPPTR